MQIPVGAAEVIVIEGDDKELELPLPPEKFFDQRGAEQASRLSRGDKGNDVGDKDNRDDDCVVDIVAVLVSPKDFKLPVFDFDVLPGVSGDERLAVDDLGLFPAISGPATAAASL